MSVTVYMYSYRVHQASVFVEPGQCGLHSYCRTLARARRRAVGAISE